MRTMNDYIQILDDSGIILKNRADVTRIFGDALNRDVSAQIDIIEDSVGDTHYCEIAFTNQDHKNIEVKMFRKVSLMDAWLFEKLLPELQKEIREVVMKIILRNTIGSPYNFELINEKCSLGWYISEIFSSDEFKDRDIIETLCKMIFINNKVYTELNEILDALRKPPFIDLIVEMYLTFGKFYIPVENLTRRPRNLTRRPGVDVWKIRDPKENNFLLFKKIRSMQQSSGEDKIKVLTTMKKNPSPYISNLIDFRIEKDILYTLKEYIVGGCLGKNMKLSKKKILDIIKTLALRLKYFHDQRMLFLDMKHENVVVDLNNNPKIIDIDTVVLEESKDRNSFVGSPLNIPPEVLPPEPKTCRASDIFSLGTIFYEMILGEMPFPPAFITIPNEHRTVFIKNARESLPSDLSKIDADFKNIIERMINLDVKNRYQSIDDLIKDLDVLINKELNGPPSEDWATKPSDTESFMRKARILTYAMNKPEEAVKVYDLLLTRTPRYIKIHFEKLKAIILRDKVGIVSEDGIYIHKRSAEIEKCLEQILSINSANFSGLSLKADYAHNVLKDYRQSIEIYEKLLALKPTNTKIYLNKANSHLQLGEYPLAIECYDKILLHEPKNFEVLLKKGNCLHNNLNNFIGAIQCYKKALILSPDNLPIHRSLGNSYFRAGKYREAIVHLDKWLNVAKNDSSMWVAKGDCHYALSEFERALECYENGLRLIKDNLLVLTKKANCLFKMERYSGACEIIDTAILNTEDKSLLASLLLQRAKCLRGMQQVNEAIEAVEDSLKFAPSNIDAILIKEDLLLHDIENKEKAEAYLQNIFSEYPNIEKEYWLKKAKKAYSNRKYDNVLDFCDKAIALDMRYYDAWFRKMDALFELNAHEKIVDCYFKIEEALGPLEHTTKTKFFEYYVSLINRLYQRNDIESAIVYSIILSEIDPQRTLSLLEKVYGKTSVSEIFVLTSKAEFLLKAGRFSEAVNSFSEVLKNLNKVENFALRKLIEWIVCVEKGYGLMFQENIGEAKFSLTNARKIMIPEMDTSKMSAADQYFMNTLLKTYDFVRRNIPFILFDFGKELAEESNLDDGIICISLALEFVNDELELDPKNPKLLRFKNEMQRKMKELQKTEANQEG